MMRIILLSSLGLLFVMFPTGYSLHCYTCNGFEDKSCNAPYSPKADHPKECFADACYKLTLKNPRYKEVIIRTCGKVPWQKVVDDPLNLTEVPWEWKTDQQVQFGYVSVNTASCLRDLCNQASHMIAPFHLIVGFCVLRMILFYVRG